MADKVVAKYVADVKDYIKEIEKATGIAQKDFEKVNKSASGLEKGLKKIGGAIAASFAVDKIVAFTAQASKLAAEGEGVRKAFERVGDPKLLDGLRAATKGTVSDLELMKQAVRASNFKIPMESLAKLFEFARRRAKETGESVDYLVNSITMGIGRKSPLILDNLGISAIELRKRFDGITIATAEVGDVARIVGDIATEEMAKMGDEIETTSDKMQQLSASTANFSEAFGVIANKVIGPAMGAISGAMTDIANDLRLVDDFNAQMAQMTQAERITKLNEITKELKDQNQAFKDLIESGEGTDESYGKIANRIDELERLSEVGEKLVENGYEQISIDEMTVDGIMKVTGAISNQNQEKIEQIKNVGYYKALIKALTEEQELENTSLERNAQILKELIAAQKALDLLKGKERKASKQDAFEKAQRAQGDLTAMSGVGIGANFFDDTLEQLKAQLAIQQEILNTNAANSMEYVTAKENVEDLTDKIENFGEQSAKTTTVTAERMEQDRIDAEEREKLQIQYQDTAINTANTIANAVANIQQASLNHEMQLLENQLQGGIISREEYERKIGVLRTESARQSKEMSLFEATTSTAMAVMNALSDSTVPYYLAVINAGLAAALGAAEIAAIASTPIPQFAKGTKNAPAGFKWVGEEGPELIHDGGGYPIITHRESMKILEKYNIESVDIDSIQRGGFDGMAASSRLQGFNDSNMLFATDRLRSSNKDGFRMLAEAIIQSNKPKRGGYA